MNTKAIQQLADATLDKYRSSIPRKAFKEFVKDIIAGENRATAFRYEARATATTSPSPAARNTSTAPTSTTCSRT